MNVNYYDKYIKYKTKYLNLKEENKYGGNGNTSFIISSKSFNNNERMDIAYTRYGINSIPEIEWKNVPSNTEELLLLCYDPDAKDVKGVEKTWIHWFVTNIDPKTTTLIDGHYTKRMNSFGNEGYDGPHPPKGTGIHHYHFKLYALKKSITTIINDNKKYDYEEIIELIKDKKNGETEIVGLYENK